MPEYSVARRYVAATCVEFTTNRVSSCTKSSQLLENERAVHQGMIFASPICIVDYAARSTVSKTVSSSVHQAVSLSLPGLSLLFLWPPFAGTPKSAGKAD
ncbi:hypothetical protein PISMIDRAFT_677981 [Pisolithus microcarpus 441]|uniref:Uncharacterized protein n=1 Tax=Pisolithus microcarpus 441 TaxID=765257 RepID=A0A0C9ZFW9_9AGAM|nr:hypothetical protein PISMIDRAFT_677981 [Pisolithus microcarpus 441]